MVGLKYNKTRLLGLLFPVRRQGDGDEVELHSCGYLTVCEREVLGFKIIM